MEPQVNGRPVPLNADEILEQVLRGMVGAKWIYCYNESGRTDKQFCKCDRSRWGWTELGLDRLIDALH